ncbi:hypothetical protein ACJIZ3_010199 [Penstemon smallii]|uniref:Transmembrane protein n=1 Tax=Penstemon smallii TaxID=265156 RepID=A0ABD3TG12_9LAMI
MSSLALLCIFLVATQFTPAFTLHHPQMIIRTRDLKISFNFNLTDGLPVVNLETQRELSQIISTEKRQKGIGSYGGGNVVHRRPAQKGAAIVLYRPSFFISSTIVVLTFFIVLVLPFHFA